MITLQESYLDLTIDEVYDIINEFDKVPWPNNFTIDKKIKFLESIRDYFIKKELYERCAKLQSIIDELEDYK